MTLKEAEALLKCAGIDEAREEARIIFERLGDIPRYKLTDLSLSCEDARVKDAIERRCTREPLGYILGEVEFYRESYEVSPACLIPRADTEVLVDLAVRLIPEGELFLDLCTGSGCVAVSTLKNTKNTTAVAIDISPAAIEIAKRNAEKNGVCERIEFREADLFVSDLSEYRPFAILSNPPYVSSSAYEGLESEIFFEPKIAFTSGEDGADLLRRLVDICKKAIKPEGFFAFEIGYDQGDIMRSLGKIHGLSVEIIKDLGARDRVALFKNK